MITKKEDLINTYIENDHGELFDAWVDAVAKFKIMVPQTDGIDFFRGKQVKFCVISSSINKKSQTEWVEDSDWLISNGYKKLTLSDLKPRTRTEYEKVTESIFDLKDEFERGELFNSKNAKSPISDEDHLAAMYVNGTIYRKVEKPIEWWEDAADYVDSIDSDSTTINEDGAMSINAKMTRDQWCDFARILLEQEGE